MRRRTSSALLALAVAACADRDSAPVESTSASSSVANGDTTGDADSTASSPTTSDAPDSTTSDMPAEPDEAFCEAIGDADTCEAVFWPNGGGACIWRDVVTTVEAQSCADASHEMRCILGRSQGAGCGPNCGPPGYDLIYQREVSPGVHELAGGCEVIPALSWQPCSADIPACECGCEVDCSRPYC